MDDKQGPAASPKKRRLSLPIAIVVSVLVVSIPIGVRVLLLESFVIPAASMAPTLFPGDHIFAWKHQTDAELGQVVVFAAPDNPDHDFVKRVVALEGDTIESIGGRLIRNGEPVPLCEVGPYQFDGGHAAPHEDIAGDTAFLYVEFLTERGHLVVLSPRPESCTTDADCGAGQVCRHELCGHQLGPHQVAPGTVWMAGDNRSNSHDSFRWGSGAGRGASVDAIRGTVGRIWSEEHSTRERTYGDLQGPPIMPADAPQALLDGVERCLASSGEGE